MKQGTYKVKTLAGMIITLSVRTETATHLGGFDKFGQTVLLPKKEIHRILPVSESVS